MINIKIENLSEDKTEVTAECNIKGKRNAIDEFTAVLEELEKFDKAIFAVALLRFWIVKEENNDKE